MKWIVYSLRNWEAFLGIIRKKIMKIDSLVFVDLLGIQIDK